MNRVKTEDEQNLKASEQEGQELHTEGPIPEKDEVKKAEDETIHSQAHDIDLDEQLKDDEGQQVDDKQ